MPTVGGLYSYEHDGGDASLPTLVYLHGAGGSGRVWPYQLRRIGGYRVLAPDLPGHGRSSGRGFRTIKEYADAIEEWLRGMGEGKVVLIGHSMGAAIGLQMARDYPQRIKGLFLMGAGAEMPVNPNLLDQILLPGRQSWVAKKLSKWSFSPNAKGYLRKRFEQQIAATRKSVLEGDLRACARFQIDSSFQRIKKAIQLLHGEQDVMMPLALAEELADKMATAKLETLAGAGHMVMQEERQQSADKLRRFLRLIHMMNN